MTRRNLLDWQRAAEESVGPYEHDVARPIWDPTDAVPYCTNECPMHDGKRCRALDKRPDLLCEPAVSWMATMLTCQETAKDPKL